MPESEQPIVHIVPTIELSEVLGGQTPYVYLKQKEPYIDGELPHGDLDVLMKVLAVYRPKVILEIGTFYGYTTLMMAEVCPDATVHTLDLPREYDRGKDTMAGNKDDFHLIESSRKFVGHYFRLDGYGMNIIQHFGDSATWSWDQAGMVDFIFIDGSHTFEYTINDTLCAFHLILRTNGKGIIMWHDVDEQHPAVLKALSDLNIARDWKIRRIAGTRLGYLNIDMEVIK
jgi:protein-L-isoaspartate O-methyltransferase